MQLYGRVLIERISGKLRSNLALSVSANLFSYLVTFCGSIIYIRILGKQEFGLYTFAFNLISICLLVNGFGAASGVLQYVSKAQTEEEQQSYLRFAFQSGSLFNLAVGGIIIIYALIMPLPIPEAKPILLAMSLFPIGRLYIDIFQAYMRARQENVLQAQFAVLNNCLLLAINIVGILCFNLYGLIGATYIGYLLMFIYSNRKFNLPSLFKFSHFVHVNVRNFIHYAFFSTLANAFSGLLFILDIIILGYVIKDTNLIATYRVATIIPFAINIIPSMIINFYYPEFAKNSHNPDKIRSLLRWVSKRIFIFSFLGSILLVLIAKPLILIIFGANYQDSVLPFQIISFGYWIVASFRIVNGNVLSALGYAKLSFYLTLLILIVNICVTYVMVRYYSINGAAISVLIIYAFSSLVGYIALKLVLRGLKNKSI